MTFDIESFPKDIDTEELEGRCRDLWEQLGIYRFDAEGTAEVFSVDTPPPYVSAAHLHVGHAMSYAQAEFVVRYQRMKGKRVFYPMGFDDNGLPTERYVEKKYKVDKRRISRKEFRALCLQSTAEGAIAYEQLWRALGLSVDWGLRYSTIDDHCRRTAQKSFIELFRTGRIYRATEPVLWDCVLETSLAQADVETTERQGTLHELAFQVIGDEQQEAVIATTRPELLAACVALYYHKDDPRYAHWSGAQARVPMFGHSVPILHDDDVDPSFGTGLMMVCTFGDAEDVARWRRDNLATRVCISPAGKMTEAAGELQGLNIDQARRAVIDGLRACGAYRTATATRQRVAVSDRSGAAVEFLLVPQWFIRCLDLKNELLERSGELAWYPEWMKVRLDQWISGLRFDWNISRQRFYGVPFPVWYCDGCSEPVIATETSLPVDPTEDPCPAEACPKCGSGTFKGESDVMDTWMTSSLSPLINANWANTPGRGDHRDVYPMSVRVQAFEIIRTWFFYTLLKSHLHTNSVPWRTAMISGWGLNENGKKISKRDLEQFTTPDGFNRYEPYALIRRYGADALRYWSAGGRLGHDIRFNERDVKAGRRVVVKLWNAARLCVSYQVSSQAPAITFADRTPEDRWITSRLMGTIAAATKAFDENDYAEARQAVDDFFWNDFCDTYLEIIKDRFWRPHLYSEEVRSSARVSSWQCLRAVLGLYAPTIPFVTEELYQRLFRERERTASLHVTAWPAFNQAEHVSVPEMQPLLAILKAVRALRSQHKVSQTRQLRRVVVDMADSSDEVGAVVRAMTPSVVAAVRADLVEYASAATATDIDGLRVDIEQ